MSNRYLVAETPYYTVDGIRRTLTQVGDSYPAPAVGDVVTVDNPAVDDEGDVVAYFGDLNWDIARDVLVNVEVVLAAVVALRSTDEPLTPAV